MNNPRGNKRAERKRRKALKRIRKYLADAGAPVDEWSDDELERRIVKFGQDMQLAMQGVSEMHKAMAQAAQAQRRASLSVENAYREAEKDRRPR